jgi:hypothetical protein
VNASNKVTAVGPRYPPAIRSPDACGLLSPTMVTGNQQSGGHVDGVRVRGGAERRDNSAVWNRHAERREVVSEVEQWHCGLQIS